MDDHLLSSLSGFAVNCLNHWIIPKRGSAWRDESEVERISWTTMSLNLLNCDCIIIDWLTSSWNNRATELAKLTAKSLFKKKPNPTKRNETKRNETKNKKMPPRNGTKLKRMFLIWNGPVNFLIGLFPFLEGIGISSGRFLLLFAPVLKQRKLKPPDHVTCWEMASSFIQIIQQLQQRLKLLPNFRDYRIARRFQTQLRLNYWPIIVQLT